MMSVVCSADKKCGWGSFEMSVCTGFLLRYLGAVVLNNYAGFGFTLIFSVTVFLFALVGAAAKRLDSRRVWYALGALVGIITFSFASEPTAEILDNYIGRYVEIEGVITEVPDEYDEYYSYVLTAQKLRYSEEEKIGLKMRITCEEKFSTGNKVAFRGFLKEITSADNSTEFDYKMYYKSKGISFSMYADEAELIEARAFIFSPVYFVEYTKNRIAAAIDRFYTDDDAGIMKAVLLGKRTEFSDEFKDILVSTSALRYLYPSFLHIFFLLSVCEFIFAAVPKRRQELLTVCAILLFAIFRGNYITFVRAALMFGGLMLYRRIRGFSHYPDIAAMVVTVCIVSNPLLLYNSGFVISVSMGMLIHLFKRPCAAKLAFIKNTRARTAVVVWIIGTLGLIPLSGYYYNGVSMYSVIFTFVYTPLSMLLFIILPPTLLLSELFGGAGIFGTAVDIVVRLMQNIPRVVALLPGYYITLGKTSAVGFLIAFLVIYILKCAADKNTKSRGFRVSASALALIMCVCAVSYCLDYGKMKVTFVNVGQGDAAIIDITGKDTILVDGGGGTADSEYNIGEEVFLPYLIAKGYSRIDLAIVSHCHRDHTEGIIAAIENLDVHSVMLPSSGEGERYRQAVVAAAEKNGTEIIYVNAGDRIEFESEFLIDVLSPVKGAELDDENDYSLALKMNYDGTSMFFGGDMTSKAEKKLLGRVGKVDIAKVSHHGSANSSSEAFVSEISPKYAVFCVGRNNMYSHPSDRAVAAYYRSGAKILRTDRMCDIVLKCNKGKVAAAWFGEVLKWQ